MNYNALKSYDGKVTDEDLNRVVDALQSIALGQGVNYTITRSPAGTTLTLDPKGGTAASCPFTAKVKTVDDITSVSLTPGTLNQLVPTNMFSDFTISDTGTYYVKCVAVSDGEKITSCSIVVDGDEPEAQTPTPFALPATVEILLALVKDGKAFRTLDCGSVELQGHEDFRTDKDPPAEPGQLVYTPYYAWR